MDTQLCSSGSQIGEYGDGFSLGKPSLVCRWRLAGGELLLANRHIRALGARELGGVPLPSELLGWVKQHIEWTLEQGSRAYPDGVLMLIVDEEGRAAMSVGEYIELPSRSSVALLERARHAAQEAQYTGIAPESLWLMQKDRLIAGVDPTKIHSGAASFVQQLAETLGIPVSCDPEIVSHPLTKKNESSVFLVSDEHGVVSSTSLNVAAQGDVASRIKKLEESYQALFEKTRSRH